MSKKERARNRELKEKPLIIGSSHSSAVLD